MVDEGNKEATASASDQNSPLEIPLTRSEKRAAKKAAKQAEKQEARAAQQRARELKKELRSRKKNLKKGNEAPEATDKQVSGQATVSSVAAGQIDNEEKLPVPSLEELEAELKSIAYKKRYFQLLRNTLAVLLVAAAAAALIATIWMPVLQIYGKSMYPTLEEGEIVISVKSPDLQTGDPIAFYYNNKLLIKRVIASPGQWVDIKKTGDVYVDGVLIDEPYLTEKSLGTCNITLPYQVPEQRWFVMGDNRAVSVDSRDSSIGCVPKEYIVGKVVFCVWPLDKFGWVD